MDHEVLKVFVISADTNGICGAKEQWAATFASKDYTSKFLVIRVVVLFCWK